MKDVEEIVRSFVHSLAERGYACRVKETGRGGGLSLFVRPSRPPRDREPDLDELRAACLDAFRDPAQRRVGRDGELRVRLRDVARRLNCREQRVGRALDAAGATVQKIGGRTWVAHDARWNQFMGVPVRTPVRTPVLA